MSKYYLTPYCPHCQGIGYVPDGPDDAEACLECIRACYVKRDGLTIADIKPPLKEKRPFQPDHSVDRDWQVYQTLIGELIGGSLYGNNL